MSENGELAVGFDVGSKKSTKIGRHWRFGCFLALLFSDILTFTLANGLPHRDSDAPRLMFVQGVLPFGNTIELFAIMAMLFIIVRYLMGDYTQRQLFWDGARQTTTSLIFLSMPSILLLVFGGAGYSTTAVLGRWMFAIVLIPTMRQVARHLLSMAHIWQLPTAVIGEGARLEEVCSIFSNSLSLGFDVRFVVSFDQTKCPKSCASATFISMQSPSSVAERLRASGCQKAVFVSDQSLSPMAIALCQQLMIAGVDIVVIPPLNQLPMLGTTVNFAFGSDVLLMHFRNNLLRLPSRVCKRIFDFTCAIALLILLTPLFLVVAYLIKRADGGAPFFVQQRVGRHGTRFDCMKFRSMHANAEKMLAQWKAENSPLYREYVENNFKLKNDPRVTKVGRWLRNTSLDELPQLVNVVMGDMSFVGPRPLIPREVSAYGAGIELYKQTRPGITGLWQISGRSTTAFADRVSSDGWYIRNWSFWYDLVILIKTAVVLLNRKGAF